jgi:hypothetical protein
MNLILEQFSANCHGFNHPETPSRVNPCWLNFWFRFARFNHESFKPFTQLSDNFSVFPATRQVHKFKRVGIKVIELPLNIPVA